MSYMPTYNAKFTDEDVTKGLVNNDGTLNFGSGKTTIVHVQFDEDQNVTADMTYEDIYSALKEGPVMLIAKDSRDIAFPVGCAMYGGVQLDDSTDYYGYMFGANHRLNGSLPIFICDVNVGWVMLGT